MSASPIRHSCGGTFTCSNCDAPFRESTAVRPVILAATGKRIDSPKVAQYLARMRELNPYVTSFPVGPRGGAMVDFGRGVTLECYLPFVSKEDGMVYPFLPLPLNGSPVHDRERSDPRVCANGTCRCERPEGLFLTRPILRALLGITDSYLNEHSRDLPGRLPPSPLRVNTIAFITTIFGEENFRFPTREIARDERRERRAEWSATPLGRRGHKPPPPHQRRRK
jgi:hypothetical protein